mmetsp:Transcript_44559/g.65559  ORF Transcript_44559/g.65559 Transcript_44559/m.65559 type:complete len:595 (-) Transcript_44559:49-1833(-)
MTMACFRYQFTTTITVALLVVLGKECSVQAYKKQPESSWQRKRRVTLPNFVYEARRSLSSRPSSLPDIDYGPNHPFDRNNTGRSLRNADDFLPIRIYFDTTALLARIGESSETDFRVNALINDVIPQVQQRWSNYLSVVPVQSAFEASFELCSELFDSNYNWGNEEKPGSEYNGVYDLIVYVTAYDVYLGEETCANDANLLAFAYPCQLDHFDRPIVGTINFCLNTIKVSNGLILPQDFEYTAGLTLHEIAHVLGMTSDQLKFFRDIETGEPLTPRPFVKSTVTCLDGQRHTDMKVPSSNTLQSGITSTGMPFFEVVTPTVTTVVRNQFNCQQMKGVRLENQPTNPLDCFGTHLDERLYFTETMSAVHSSEASQLSPVTLAFLEDSGWYKANFKAVDVLAFGLGAGCDFVYEDCVQDGVLPPSSKGFFCATPMTLDAAGGFTGMPSCNPGHTHVAVCDLADHSINHPDLTSRQPNPYFGNSNMRPVYFQHADYCPIPHLVLSDCRKENSQQFKLPGESYSKDSKCYDAMLPTQEGSIPYSVCLETYCNKKDQVVEVVISGQTIVCERDFQTHDFPGFGGRATFDCPRLVSVCPR